MNIILYNTSCDNRELDKISSASTIALVEGISVAPTERLDILDPVFILDFNSAYLRANYLYCDTFLRYYYIRSAVQTGKKLELRCSVDVRQTYAAGIRASTGTIIRAEDKGSPTIYPDSKFPVNPGKKYITSIVLPETSKTMGTDIPYSYLLTVIGGEPSI